MFVNQIMMGGNTRGVVANVRDYDIVVSEFELQSLYNVHCLTPGHE